MTERVDIHLTWGDDFDQSILLYMIIRGMPGDPGYPGYKRVVGLETVDAKPGDLATYPSAAAILNLETAQRLMNELWGMGFRPKGDGTPGQLKATEAHLQDMRDLSQRLLDHILVKK